MMNGLHYQSPQLNPLGQSHFMDPNTAQLLGQFPFGILPGKKRSTSMEEKRLLHNAMERQRRECLSNKFDELARSLPNIKDTTKLSRVVIIDKTIDYVSNSKNEIQKKQQKLSQLVESTKSLRDQVNQLRQQLGLEAIVFDESDLQIEADEFSRDDKDDSHSTASGSDRDNNGNDNDMNLSEHDGSTGDDSSNSIESPIVQRIYNGDILDSPKPTGPSSLASSPVIERYKSAIPGTNRPATTSPTNSQFRRRSRPNLRINDLPVMRGPQSAPLPDTSLQLSLSLSNLQNNSNSSSSLNSPANAFTPSSSIADNFPSLSIHTPPPTTPTNLQLGLQSTQSAAVNLAALSQYSINQSDFSNQNAHNFGQNQNQAHTQMQGMTGINDYTGSPATHQATLEDYINNNLSAVNSAVNQAAGMYHVV
ncbi:hypothetical protein BKA69DRAFT_1126314 [Paraphysoderma sedebokerense]|nr:hypothetical protein BKA69DRAFT_1126314 [Paraphysoderma sedebokerense]